MIIPLVHKNMRLVVLVLAALMVGLIGQAKAELNLDFDLVNKTGYTIKAVYIAPSSSDEWEDNILSEPFKDGETLEVTFSPKEKAKKWDIRIEWADGDDDVYWKGYNLTEISKLTLYYDHDSGTTTAKAE